MIVPCYRATTQGAYKTCCHFAALEAVTKGASNKDDDVEELAHARGPTGSIYLKL